MADSGKDPAAQALGRKRWAGKSDAEKAAHVGMMNRVKRTKLTAARRKEIAKKAARARWAKTKKKGSK